ncbi:uncharacterized protein [Ptychodera flava]|uniref:uncharacterized protein n=1 Tax=Ptychodera flava TaxID=63121 RepID=UPI003969D2CD
MMRGDMKEEESTMRDEDQGDHGEIWENSENDDSNNDYSQNSSEPMSSETKWTQFLDADQDEGACHDYNEEDGISYTTNRKDFDNTRKANRREWRKRKWERSWSASESKGNWKYGRKRSRGEDTTDSCYQDSERTVYQTKSKQAFLQRNTTVSDHSYLQGIKNTSDDDVSVRCVSSDGKSRKSDHRPTFMAMEKPKSPLNQKPETPATANSKWSAFLSVCEDGDSQQEAQHSGLDSDSESSQYASNAGSINVRNSGQNQFCSKQGVIESNISKWDMFVRKDLSHSMATHSQTLDDCTKGHRNRDFEVSSSFPTCNITPAVRDISRIGKFIGKDKVNKTNLTVSSTNLKSTFEVDDELDSILNDLE